MSNELSKKVGCNLIKVAFHPKFSLILQAVRNSEWSGKQKGNYTIVDETYQDFQAWKCVVHEKKNEKLFRRVPFLCMRRKAKLSKNRKKHVIMTCVKKCYSSTNGWCPPKGSQKCQNTRISAKQGIFMFNLHAIDEMKKM